jgi:hypothetical protein
MELHRPVIDEQYLPMLAEHDLACPVCYAEHAVLNCNAMVFGPCWSCWQKGWRVQQHNRVWLKVQHWFSRNGDLMQIFVLMLVLTLSAALLTGCPKQCKPKMARCQGTTAQLCRPDGKWTSVVDCGKVDPAVPWTCVQLDPQTCRCRKPVPPAK